MAAVSGSQPKLPAGKGCFKCGKTGHWSRDCTAPPSEWIARGPTQAGASDAPVPGQASQPLQDLDGQLQVPVAVGKRKRQKPKLTVEHLKERHGIAEVFHTFPKKFKQNFKGHGHEAGDLRRLLEMYIGWQHRIFPYAPFDVFVEGLEKLGSSYVLKMELRELRSEVLKAVEKPQEDGGWTGMGAPSDGRADQDLRHTGNDDMPDWDDDDLAAMQAEPMEPRGASAKAAPQQQAPNEMELDDDELLDMMGDMQPEPCLDSGLPVSASMQPPGNDTLEDEAFDDDELLELAQAGRSQTDQDAPQLWPQQQALPKDPAVMSSKKYHVTITTPFFPPGNKPAEEQIHTGQPMASHQQALPGSIPGPGPPASAAENAYLELDDDELIELACASLDPQKDGAAVPEQPSQQMTKPPVSDTQTPSAYTGNAAIGAGTSHEAAPNGTTNPDTEYSLDDDELLALAATQLHEAS